jgi:hypothetical protein
VEHDDVSAGGIDLAEHRVERGQVAVDVGQYRDPHENSPRDLDSADDSC